MKNLTFLILVICNSTAIIAQNFDWTAQNSGVTVKLNDVYFTNNQTGWAVGNNGTIVTTTNGGQTWSTQSSGTSENLLSVIFVSANIGWTVGGSLNKIMLKTIDGGITWQDASVNSIPNRLMLDIAFSNINNGWTITIDSIYMTTDGGNTWNSEGFQNTISEQRCRAISVTSDTTAFVSGSRYLSVTSDAATVFYRNTIDMPLAWSISPFNPSTTDNEFISISFTGAGIGFVGGQNGRLYKKSGVQYLDPWNLSLDLSSTGAGSIESISFSNDNNGMFATSLDVSGTINTLIYHTTDTGDNWSATPDSIQGLISPTLYAPDTTNAWLIGFGGKIYKGVRLSVGINEIEPKLDVHLYPNPTTDIINIEVNTLTTDFIYYKIIDVSGRVLETGKSLESRFLVNLSNYNKGVYFIKLRTEEVQSTFSVLKK